jgi:DnaD/phage-associated family protein
MSYFTLPPYLNHEYFRRVEENMKSGCQVVDQIEELEVVGNIVLHLWYKNITFSSGKTHFVAITLLADILYWYRPTIIRHESWLIVGSKTKFRGDMLQKSYHAFTDTYRFTKRQVKDAIDFLVKHHLLIREFRTISSSSIILNNVMYVQPVAGNLKRVMEERCNVSDLVSICPPVTPERTTSSPSTEGLSPQGDGAPEVGMGTYTESSSKNYSENHEEDQGAAECPMTFYIDNGFGRMGTYIQEKIKSWCDSLSESLVVEAMKRAVEQGKYYWSYVDAILVKWEQLKFRNVKDAREKENHIIAEKESRRRPGRLEADWFTEERFKPSHKSRNDELEKMLDELEASLDHGYRFVM